jgi:hypothetical protein
MSAVACAVPGRRTEQASNQAGCSVAQTRTNDPIRIRETTMVELSGHRVGISNIWERELPDENGTVLPRMSATVSLVNVATRREQPDFHVFAGSIFSIGGDRYCVDEVEEGSSTPGNVYLHKVVPDADRG